MDCRLMWRRSLLWLVVGVVTALIGFAAIVVGAAMTASEVLAVIGVIVLIFGFCWFFAGLLMCFAAAAMFFVTGIVCAPIGIFDVLDPAAGFAVPRGTSRGGASGGGFLALLKSLLCGCEGGGGKGPEIPFPFPPDPADVFGRAAGMVKNAQATLEDGLARAEQLRRDAEAALEQKISPEERERLQRMKEEMERQAATLAEGVNQASATAGRYASRLFGR